MKTMKQYKKIITYIILHLWKNRKKLAEQLTEMPLSEGDTKLLRFGIIDKNPDPYALHDDVVIDIKICE